MLVNVFETANEYMSWVNTRQRPIEIVSVLTFGGELVVTYKLK